LRHIHLAVDVYGVTFLALTYSYVHKTTNRNLLVLKTCIKVTVFCRSGISTNCKKQFADQLRWPFQRL